ncbi:WG repeat-containing protein [Cohnella yongneupensis]|uniref:WG repeat-containing protein n=1 Tax=Cohnella yongneupensis TaxID=425006 RepID=A0ABW0QX68_9BACL
MKTAASIALTSALFLSMAAPAQAATTSFAIQPQYEEVRSFDSGTAAVKSDGGWGLIDKTGKLIVSPRYDDIERFNEHGLAEVVKDEKHGLIDRTGKEIVVPVYSYIGDFENGLAIILDNKYGLIDVTGKVVVAPKYDRIEDKRGLVNDVGLIEVELNDKYGLVNKAGVEVLKPEFDYTSDFVGGLAVVKQNAKMALIDKSGKFLTPVAYDWIDNFSEGLAAVSKNKKIGYINASGKEVIPPKYDDATKFVGSTALVDRADKTGLINKSGKEIVPPKYDYALGFNDSGVSIVNKGGKYGLINRTGKEIAAVQYYNIEKQESGFFKVTVRSSDNNYSYGFYNKSGMLVAKPVYSSVGAFNEGMAAVRKGGDKDGKWGFIDAAGKVIVQPKYDEAFDFRDGLAPVITKNKLGYINKQGKEAIKPQFEYDRSFSGVDIQFRGGVAMISKSHKVGLIDKTGKVITKPAYDRIDRIANGLFRVSSVISGNWGWGLLNAKGQVLIKPELSYVQEFMGKDQRFAITEKAGKKGLIDNTGKQLLLPIYDDIDVEFKDEKVVGFIQVKKGNQFGLVNLTGKVIVPVVYDSVNHWSFDDYATAGTNGGKTAVYNLNGVLITKDYDSVNFVDGWGIVTTGGKSGIITKTGKVVVEPVYEDIQSFSEGLAAAKIDGKWGYITLLKL